MINIIKTKQGKFLVGEGGKIDKVFRIKKPFEMVKTEAGISITPYDVNIIDTFIPFIDFTDEQYEYIIKAEVGISNFYAERAKAFSEEIKKRHSSSTNSTNSEI